MQYLCKKNQYNVDFCRFVAMRRRGLCYACSSCAAALYKVKYPDARSVCIIIIRYNEKTF